MKPEISIVIPAYNEEKRLSYTLEIIISHLDKNFSNWEILVVDDGSEDSTADIVKNFEEVVLIKQPRNLGKGAAVRKGMIEAKGEIRVFSDADLSTPIYELDKLLASIKRGNDIAIGSRGLNYELIKKHQPFYREFMGKTFNKIVQALVLSGIKDTQCGFKAFTEKSCMEIFPRSKIDGFGFDVEILWLARKLGFKIEEIPVEWYNDSRSRVNPIKDSYRMLVDIVKIKRLHKGLN